MLGSGDVLLIQSFLLIHPSGFPSNSPLPSGSVLCSIRTQKLKTPLRFNPAGFLVLATSYSRTTYRRTTIGAAAFHCRVRDGNGWGHCASVTRNLRRACRHKFLVRDPRFETRGSESFRRITIHELRFTNDSRFTLSKNSQFSDIYIRGRDSRFVTPLQRFPDSRFNALTIHEFEEHFRASFCFEIICLFC